MSKKSVLFYIATTLLVAFFVISMPTPSIALRQLGASQGRQDATNAANRQDAMLNRIKTRADEMIAIRLSSLQNLTNRLQNDPRLTDKTNLLEDVATTTGSLTALKTKIDADTDVATAKADAKSIVGAYKIYIFFEPKIRLLAIIDTLQAANTRIASLVTRVQNLLNTLKNEGKDVTAAQTALTDISARVSSINTILATDTTFLQNTSVTSGNPASVFVVVRKDLATIRMDIAKIREDFATIRTSLHPFFTTNKQATSSAQ